MAGMTELSTVPTVHPADVLNDRINAEIQAIAQETLAATGGRAVYSYESDSFKYIYQGDIIEEDGTVAYGQTPRLYWFYDAKRGEHVWTPQSPHPSITGSGLVNMGWQFIKDCTDPVAVAKVRIWHLLMNPELDIAGRVMRGYRANNSLSAAVAERVQMRLDEVLEQLVLSNPAKQDLLNHERAAGGLDLVEIAGGKSAIGWALRALKGAVGPTVKTVFRKVEQLTSWDELTSDGPGVVTEAMLADSELGRAADEMYEANLTAKPDDVVADHKEGLGGKRGQEAIVYNADALHRESGLPYVHRPDVPTRKMLLAELDDDATLPLRSLKAYYDLVAGDPTPEQALIPDEWLNIWRDYSADDAYKLLGMAASFPGAPALFVQAAIGFRQRPAKTAVTAMRRRLAALCTDTAWASVKNTVVDAYIASITGEDDQAWRDAAAAVIDYPLSPVRDMEHLLAILEDAV